MDRSSMATMHHKQVELCGVGGLAFYLRMRFWTTNEFEDFNFHDFLKNLKWFDIKLLTMQQGQIMITIRLWPTTPVPMPSRMY
jgi:hypothetical protein